MDLWFAVHKLEFVLANNNKTHFEGLVHLLRYVGEKKNLVLRYYSKIEYETFSGILRQDGINSDNQLIVFSYENDQDCLYTAINTNSYDVFYQCGLLFTCFVQIPVLLEIRQHRHFLVRAHSRGPYNNIHKPHGSTILNIYNKYRPVRSKILQS